MVGPNGLEPLTSTVSRKRRPRGYKHSPQKQNTSTTHVLSGGQLGVTMGWAQIPNDCSQGWASRGGPLAYILNRCDQVGRGIRFQEVGARTRRHGCS